MEAALRHMEEEDVIGNKEVKQWQDAEGKGHFEG